MGWGLVLAGIALAGTALTQDFAATAPNAESVGLEESLDPVAASLEALTLAEVPAPPREPALIPFLAIVTPRRPAGAHGRIAPGMVASLLGPSAPSTGRQAPRPSAFDRAGADSGEPNDRPAYWRRLFVTSYLDLPSLEPNADRDNNRPGDELVLLGQARSGTCRLHYSNGDTAILATGGSLLLFDGDRGAMARLARHELFYVALPRREVVAAMGREPVPAGATFLCLPEGGLTPILSAQMRTLTEQGSHLSVTESAAAVRAATGLALALLSQLRDQPVLGRGRRDDALFAAARRYLELHCGRHDLMASRIAAALGCSRAHLYRLFAARGRTVGGMLRDVRLRRAHAMIETQLTRPIGLIAYDCGYTDLSAFGKAFKRRFGVSPSDWRSSSLALVPRDLHAPAAEPASPDGRPACLRHED